MKLLHTIVSFAFELVHKIITYAKIAVFSHGLLVSVLIIGGLAFVVAILAITAATSPYKDTIKARRSHRQSNRQYKRYIKRKIKHNRHKTKG